MNSLYSPDNPLMLPTGEFEVPVCVGDMPTHRYQIPLKTITEEVALYLEARPEVPGVILMDGAHIHSVIPRHRIFERLGHIYGVELFLRKPISDLQQHLDTKMYALSSDLRIQDAINTALRRPLQDIYDPFVIFYESGEIRLLDMYVLLVAQTQALQSVNNLIGSLTRLERVIKADAPLQDVLSLSLASLRQVVPFHRVAIHVREAHYAQLSLEHRFIHLLDGEMMNNSVFQIISRTKRPLHVDDVRMVPGCEDLSLLDGVRSWMGMPLLDGMELSGMMSLMRVSSSPFNKEEMNISQEFAELVSSAL